MTNVKQREEQGPLALTRNEVHDHFKRVLAGTKWEPITIPRILVSPSCPSLHRILRLTL
jgi:hypothetical protein